MTDVKSAPAHVLAARAGDPGWWRQAVVYQIYPRSFADGNGDGIGDLAGIISRVDHLAELGVDAVWMSPFYPSALADGGYDVDDYRDVDPRIGTLDQFDVLVEALHVRGIRLIIDLVPNHSSDRHEWFQAALAAKAGSPERDRFIFRDGLGENGELPPSDWRSLFGGPAWTRVPDGQWYLHIFAKEQPDWNWANPEVHADFLRTLAFWGDRGVDGFRVDVANALTKRLPEVLPSQADLGDETLYAVGDHWLWDRDDVHDIYAEWRALFDRYDPPLMAVAEAWVPAERRVRYADAAGLGQAFNFDLLRADWDPEQFRTIVSDNLALAEPSGSSTTWVFSNHDVVRHATRYGLAGEATATTGSSRAGRSRSRTETSSTAVAGGHPAGPGTARQHLCVPRGGTRPAGGGHDPRRSPPGRGLLPQGWHRNGPGRVPGAAPVERTRDLLRVRPERRPPAAAGLVRRVRGRCAGEVAGLDPALLPPGAQPAPQAADHGDARVAHDRLDRRRVPAAERLGVDDEFRHGADRVAGGRAAVRQRAVDRRKPPPPDTTVWLRAVVQVSA